MKRTIELRAELPADPYDSGLFTVNIDDTDIRITDGNDSISMPHGDFDLVCDQLSFYRKMMEEK